MEYWRDEALVSEAPARKFPFDMICCLLYD